MTPPQPKLGKNWNVDYLGFMVVETTGSTSGIMSFLWFSKQYTVAGEICKTNKKLN